MRGKVSTYAPIYLTFKEKYMRGQPKRKAGPPTETDTTIRTEYSSCPPVILVNLLASAILFPQPGLTITFAHRIGDTVIPYSLTDMLKMPMIFLLQMQNLTYTITTV